MNPHVSSQTKTIMERALSLATIEESDPELDSNDSYIPDDDDLEISDNDTDSEIELLVDEPEEQPGPSTMPSSGDKYFGKKKCFIWEKTPLQSASQTRHHNVIKEHLSSREGPARALGNKATPKQAWDLFFTPEMIDEIVKHTNVKLTEMRRKIQFDDSPAYKNTENDELNALLGLILLCCIFKSLNESLHSLFYTSIIGRPIFRAIMTEKRCSVLLRALRFDDSQTRKTREEIDKAACISNIFNLFIENCKRNYSLGAYATIDETLVPFRGRVKFRVCMPNKPSKYGIKVMCLTDAHNAYLYNAYVYTGKGSDGLTLSAQERNLTIPSQSVIRLTKCIYGTNRNITCGNWFTSIELATELKKHKLTLVGTVKKNKPQIPPEFLPSKNREIGSTLYGFTKDNTLISYVPKKDKAVILLSTMHHSICTDISNKPEIISFYNATKSGVDTLDMKCKAYSPNRKTRRWPLVIFYHLIAVASSNAHIIYEMYPENKKKSRYDFILEIALSLCNSYMKKRLQIPNLPEELKKIIKEAVGEQEAEQNTSRAPMSDRLEKRRNCRFCPYKKNRMTSYKCVKCGTPICLEHAKKTCDICIQ
ncbi:DDE_Tnp_1_7 domain-containing protein [Trichonephila inaurata madagascariensis]|uniref:DDE_Tnp_1_7 domain-containing protein n=1 Tax=Trichonephila inaurata madagascariensis TaxID=2747483 RepID=A0A8X6WVV4_9ARAC|nr:DDE_Tnp_1_7 domain-containing protein [Trichonephila inaurata madagascariensis]